MNGTVYKVGEIEKFDSGFYKRAVAIKTAGEYEQTLKFELMKDKAGQWNLQPGAQVKMRFDLRGRETADGRIFNTLVCYSWSEAQPAPAPMPPASDEPASSGDDLPF